MSEIEYPAGYQIRDDRIDALRTQLAKMEAERDEARQNIEIMNGKLRIERDHSRQLEGALRGLCDKLDRWWYEADPTGEVPKGEPHPWTKEARAALASAPAAQAEPERPRIVCLCGSGRFKEAFDEAEFQETAAGHIVLTIGCNTKDIARDVDWSHLKPMLDELHKRKIDLADEVLVLNVGGYIGESTRGEIAYAKAHGKPLRWLEPPAPPQEEKPGAGE